MRDLSEISFSVFDVETTGLSPYHGDRVIEIAIVKVHKGEIVSQYETLINPQRPVTYEAYQVNGITDEMLESAPNAEEILPAVVDFVKDTCLVAHHIKFDFGFVNNELLLAGYPRLDEELTVDTVKMARYFVPYLDRYSLQSVARYFGVDSAQKHRALVDVEMTAKIFLKLLKMAQDDGCYDIESLVNAFGLKKKRVQKKI